MSIQGRKLASKSSSSKQLQDDTAEKVRTIRERQSQWMRQREEAKARTPKVSKIATSVESLDSRNRNSSSNLDTKFSTTDFDYEPSSRDPIANPRRKPLYSEPKRDHSNIITWVGNGGNSGRARRPPSAQHKRSPSSKSTIKLDSSRSVKSETGKGKAYEPLNYGNPMKSATAVKTSPQTLYNKLQPIATKDDAVLALEDRADAREEAEGKNCGDLLINPLPKSVNMNLVHSDDRQRVGSKHMAQDLNPDMINALAETVAQRLKTTLHRDKDKGSDDIMSTHLCSLCKTLMSGSRHTPTALIPCGHTFCKVCVRDCKKCPNCQMRVSSTAVNTVLQQIIGDYKVQKEKERLLKLEEQTRKYVDEYQSLSLRSSALAEEAEVILNNMEAVTEDIFQENKHVKKLQVDEQELKQKIQELQNQLTKNRTKFTESKERCENLEFQYNEEKQRLSLVEDTVRTIRQSKERVKMMVHNFAPGLNLENYD